MASRFSNLLEQLKQLAPFFGEGSAAKKTALLEQCAKEKSGNSKEIEGYHALLLFILGYTENNELHTLAKQEMERLAQNVKLLPASKKEKLDRSGIAFTGTQGAYSLTLVKWLLAAFPGQVALHSLDESATPPKDVLKYSLPEMEFELLADEKLKPLKWLEKASGRKNRAELLAWLVKQVDAIEANDLLKEQLFESLGLYVTISPETKTLSKSFGHVEQQPHFYHSGELLKKFDERALIQKKLPAPKKLSTHQKNEIIEKARVALVLLNRETDPVTYCNADGLLVYELEHGLSIALFSMWPERRMPLESYIGFMMFKNGYPMAYGGGWLFGRRSLLGINIFEAYRGGESAFVFCQLLRTYHQSFGAGYFEVEPYQFGKNNPEGLQSGAFWFYYRFGFRPVNKELRELALKEAEVIKGTKGYRSSMDTLKQFTRSNVAVNFKDDKTPLNPSAISNYISEQIVNRFGGDRVAAESYCAKKIKAGLGIGKKTTGFEKLGLFVGLCIDFTVLKTSDKKKLSEFMSEKEKSEFRYIALCSDIDFEKLLVKDVLQRAL